jgi:hypothetical protein
MNLLASHRLDGIYTKNTLTVERLTGDQCRFCTAGKTCVSYAEVKDKIRVAVMVDIYLLCLFGFMCLIRYEYD